MKHKKITKNGFPLTHFWFVGLHCTIRGTRIFSYSLLDWRVDKGTRTLFSRYPYVVSVPAKIINNSFESNDSFVY